MAERGLRGGGQPGRGDPAAQRGGELFQDPDVDGAVGAGCCPYGPGLLPGWCSPDPSLAAGSASSLRSASRSAARHRKRRRRSPGCCAPQPTLKACRTP